MESNSEAPSSCFTVHQGPDHLHDPLGHSTFLPHYIKPVYPNYVTEYEDAFKWPENASAEPRQVDHVETAPALQTESPPPIDYTLDQSPWLVLEQSLQALVESGYERQSVASILPEIHERHLQSGIEGMYHRCVNHLHKSASIHEPKFVRRLYSQVIKSVEDIKNE